METVLVSAAMVAIAEIGDKTQLLAIVLAAKFRKPVPIVLGILAATLLNHAAAASIGYLIAEWLNGKLFQIIVGAAFIVMAGWALIPDKEDDEAASRSHGGVFLTTLIAFFFVEIGDKTQIATSLLAAQFHNIPLVTLGTTIGMMAQKAEQPGLPILKAMKEARRMGEGVDFILQYDIEELLPLPLDEVRRRLNFITPTVYNAIPEEIKQSLLKPKLKQTQSERERAVAA